MADLDLQTAIEHHKSGRLADAEKIYREILARDPQNADALHLLGALAGQSGQMEAAVDLISRAIAICPTNATYYINFGNILRHIGRIDEAISSYRNAIRVNPDDVDGQFNLGNALMQRWQFADAIHAYQQAIRIEPELAVAYDNLGVALNETGRSAEAIEYHQHAICLKPYLAEAYNNLSNALNRVGRNDDAIAACQHAIELMPDFVEAHGNLGNAMQSTGRLDEAIACYQHAVFLRPDFTAAHSNLVYSLHFNPRYDARMIAEEHRRWNQRHAEPLKKFIQPHTNTPDPGRALRIGYLSPDFRSHVVGRNLLPLLRQHDREQMEIFCYSSTVAADALTEQLRSCADFWREIAGLSDSQAADLIRKDRIDILVDLTLHMANNRLLIFAHKPAPVQVTYLGYCSSTGLETMDYRLSDPHLDPPDSDLSLYSEQTIYLPETYWCYNTAGPTPEPSPPPANTTGFITFGCLNNFSKVSAALDLWAEILRNVPTSRLIVHSPQGAHLNTVRKRFADKSISSDRLDFPRQQDWPEYVKTYGRIDIALDPFPWGGGITTCDALWMGVPVVTLVGQTAVGRGGASILSNIALPELIAKSPQEYVEIAVNLAGDLPRLTELRRTLRPTLQASPLMDAPRFARNVEAAYRQMWRNWCTNPDQLATNSKSV